jgi:hypothetical protein
VMVKRNRSRDFGVFAGYDSLDFERVDSGMSFAVCVYVSMNVRAPC